MSMNTEKAKPLKVSPWAHKEIKTSAAKAGKSIMAFVDEMVKSMKGKKAA